MDNIKFPFVLVAVALVSLSFEGSSAEFYTFSYDPEHKSVSYYLHNVTDDLNQFTITNIVDENFGFMTVAVHTFRENVTLSYLSYVMYGEHVTGTNIGLYWDKSYRELKKAKDIDVTKKMTVQIREVNTTNDAMFYLLRNSKIKLSESIDVYLSFNYYEKDVPIPGGCNLSFESMIAPYQKVFYDKDIITVMSQPPFIPDDVYCTRKLVDVTMYHIFFSLDPNDPFEYFSAIDRMISVQNIEKYGRVVPPTERGKYKRTFSAYTGVGEVFAVVANYNGKKSSYIPAASFGCNISDWNSDCTSSGDVKWIAISVVSLILGSFLCVFGHRFFKSSMFLIGTLSSVLVVYTILLLGGDNFHFNFPYTSDFLILGPSLIFGIFWVIVWVTFQSPLINTHLTFVLANIFIVSTVYYTGISDFSIMFSSDVVYWLSFSCMMLSVLILWMTFDLYVSHILSLSILGSYLVILPTSFILGANLQYILVNMKRRMAIKDFNWVVVSPPFTILDLILSVIGVVLIIAGFWVQWTQQRGKQQFPFRTNRSVQEIGQLNERTPLLNGPARPEYT